MSSRQLRLLLFGLLGLSIAAFLLVYFVGLSVLKKQSHDMIDLKLKNQTAAAQYANLEIARKEIEKYSYFKQVASTVIPNDKDQAKAVLDILGIADQSGITLASITFPSSNLGGSGASATAANSKAISQAKPVSGIPGLYSIELTITPASGSAAPAGKEVTYPKVLDFLRRIESNRRTSQITQVNISPLADSKQIDFSLTVNIFIKP